MRKHILSTFIAICTVVVGSAQNFHVNEDFNGGALPTSWTNNAVSGTQAWTFTANSGNNLDGTSMAYFDDDALGGSSTNNTAELLTPVFDNSSSTQTTLSFDYNFRQFNGIPDRFDVDVYNGTSWVNVFSVNVNDCGNWILPSCINNFPRQVIDISAYANANCQVRFLYHDGNDWGWYVGLDNVVVSSPFPNDVGVAELIDPTPGCGLTSTQPVQVLVKNYGTQAASNFGIHLDLNNANVLNETITTSIPGGDSLLYTFTGTVNMQSVGTYNVKAYTTLTGDGNNVNDTLDVQVENEPSYVPTYTEDFEGVNLWKVEGQNASWALGTPNNTFISAATSGTNAYVTNLSGNYNSNEESYLVSPCFDFSSMSGDPIMNFNLIYDTELGYDRLTFESSIDNGVTWQPVLASVNPQNWYNVGQAWEGNSGGWVPVENVLTGLGGQSSVKLRFKLSSDFNTVEEGVGIDDFSLRFPQPIDISVNSILYPSTTSAPICGLANENIIIELENKGANTITTVDMTYRINGTSVTETFNTTIAPNTITSYTFTAKYNFTGLTTADIDVWADVTGDGFAPNDSIMGETITNTSSTAIFAMNFAEDFTGIGWVAGNGGTGGGSLLGPGWSRTPATTGFADYTWHVDLVPTADANSGPDFGRGGSGNYLHTSSNIFNPNNTTATVETPCIDLGTVNGAILQYWTHGFGLNVPTLYVELHDGSNWVRVDTVSNYPQTSSASAWNQQTVNLNQYAGRRIKVRFITTKLNPFGGGDLGIDDIEIFEPIPEDAKVTRLISPVSGCDPSGVITMEVENFGFSPLTDIPVSFSIDNGFVVEDTIYGTLASGATTQFTFPITGNFTQKATTYSVSVKTAVVNDSNLFNDELIVDITNTSKDLTFVEDFESFVDGVCNTFSSPNGNDADVLGDGWEEVSTNTYQWHVHDVTTCGGGTPSGLTGPSTDHTTGTGKFIYTEASGSPSGSARIVSPCVDFTGRAGAAMKFWYHFYGATIGTLYIDVLDSSGTWNLDVGGSITGQQQTAETSNWEEQIVKFNQFAGQVVQIRFRATAPSSYTADLAIDDISFFAPYGKDARMLAVTGPEAGCDIGAESYVSVQIDNFGTEVIQEDSLTIFLQIDNNPPISEVVTDSIEAEQAYDFTFSQPVDLSVKGKTYLIKTWTSLNGEEDPSNDTITGFKIFNTTRETDYYENFETFRDSKCDQMVGQVLENGWTASDDDSFSWNVQASQCGKGSATTPTGSTGPSGDRTSGDGIFMYAEADGSGVADFTSPCIDLTNNNEPRLSFWYHRYGSNMASMAVLVDTNGVTNQVATLNGQSQTSADDNWRNFTVDLTDYKGHFVSVIFRTTKATLGATRSDMALDDIFFYEAISNDAGVTEILQPSGDACSLSAADVVVRIENFGLNDILPGELTVQYNANSGPYVSEVVQQQINAGTTLDYTFTTQIDLSIPGKKDLLALTVLSGDSVPANDFALKEVENRSPGIPRYFMDFENHIQGANYNADDLRDFSRTPANGGAGTYMWHVQTGAAPYIDGQPPIPPGPPTGPSGDHTYATNTSNGAGTYMLVESDLKQLLAPIPPTIPDATLELPCGVMDFSNSANKKVLLSFWYHMFGQETGDLFVDVASNGVWYNGVGLVSGPQQFDDTDRWLLKQVVLDRFVDSSNVEIRFRAKTAYIPGNSGSGRGGDIAIDDIEILDRLKRDASIFSLKDPESDCGLGVSEDFEVRLQNVGTEDILKLNMGYQIIFTPFGGNPIAFPIVKDSIIGQTIVPLAFYDFAFQNLDMSSPGSYKIKVWTEYNGDLNSFNDTLCETIVNTTRPFPGCDDFSDLLFDDMAKNFKDGILPNSWEGNTSAYTFKASIEGNADVPELKGHTSGLNDIFMLAFDPDGNAGQEATLTSACFDLNTTPAANLEFYYVMPNAGSVLYVEARQVGGAWQRIDTITDPTPTWERREVVLVDFVGGFVEFRFTGVNTGAGYYALDDVCVVRPDPQQVFLQNILDPVDGFCFYPSDQEITVRLRNDGIDNIGPLRIVLAIDKGIISNPRGNFFASDTMYFDDHVTQAPFFEPGDRRDFVLNAPGWQIDMTEKTDYYIHVWVLLDGDNNIENNIRLDYKITHPGARSLPYLVDFETLPDPLNGLTLIDGTGLPPYTWLLNAGANPDAPNLSGPGVDHTKGPVDSSGLYLCSRASGGELGELIAAFSPCIDLTSAQQPELKYWYHMFGFEMGNMYLQINDDFGWVTVDSLFGEDPDQSLNARTPWKSRIVDLSNYKGKFIKYRFISERGSGQYSNMALDDINVYDALSKDISPVDLKDPATNDSTYCYSATNPFVMRVINNGTDSLDLDNDTVRATVVIRQGPTENGPFTVLTTLTQEVTENVWTDPLGGGGTILPVPRDSIFEIEFDSTFDMSAIGDFYRFDVNVSLDGDLIASNDDKDYTIEARRSSGQIVNILPNDSICKDDAVTLVVEGNFGELQWEEISVANYSNPNLWRAGQTPPINKREYNPIGLTEPYILRARVCPQLLLSEGIDETTNEVPLEIFNPVRPINASGGRCSYESEPDVFVVEVPITTPSVTDMNYYNAKGDNALLMNSLGDVNYPFFNWDQGLFAYDSTTTVYARSVIHIPSVANVGTNGLYCLSDSSTAIIRVIEHPVNIAGADTNFVDLPLGSDDTTDICNPGEDLYQSGFIIDAGVPANGLSAEYTWYLIDAYDDGNQIELPIKTQTLAIDPWLLELDSIYKYQVTVNTDSNCMSTGTVILRVNDDCIVNIEEYQLRKEFDIFPNPVSDVLTITHESTENFNGEIRLFSTEGQLLQSIENVAFGKLTQEIDMSELAKGVYLIKIETDKGTIVQKVIKS